MRTENETATAVPQDARVTAVLAVLRGAPLNRVADKLSVDPTLLERWVGAFITAGTAKVINRPDPREANERDRFLATFSYEMRTPLAVALGWVGLLAGGGLPASTYPTAVVRLEDALGQLAERIVEAELLVGAALGGLHVERTRLSVGDLCAHLDVGIIGGVGADHVVEVDPALFGRVVGDLWEAASLPPLPRSCWLEVHLPAPWVELRIVREADPIPTDVLEALFEPFAFDHLNTGVTSGLYLARALTVAHGGTIGVDQDDSSAALWVRVPQGPEFTAPTTAPGTGGTP